MTVTVLGSGSWGTALAILFARNGADVALWGRDVDEIQSIGTLRENVRYLPGFVLPESVRAVNANEDLPPCDLWVVATPSHAVRAVAERIVGDAPAVLMASKGIEATSSSLLLSVVVERRADAQTAVVSGPNLALEIVRGIPTAAVVASKNQALAERVRDALMCKSYRVYTSDDVDGVEIAGALKNVLAIGAGLSDGLGFGDNTKGALLARGLHEMTTLGMRLGGRVETFMGIAGVGDLFATAASRLSRNYRIGRLVGEGSTVHEALEAIGQVAEGIDTAEAALRLARQNQVSTPIIESVDNVLRGRISAREAVTSLMERTPRAECGQ